MTRKQVWRYFCEFCGKGSLSAGHMGAHEKHCTANPNRICRMHVNFEETQRPMAELLAAINTKASDFGVPEVRKLAANCPMCILSAIRISGIGKWDGDPESAPRNIPFYFKAELKRAWDVINEAKTKSEGYYR